MAITYFFIGRIYYGHLIIRRRRREQAENDIGEEERGEGNVAEVENQGYLFFNIYIYSECLKSTLVWIADSSFCSIDSSDFRHFLKSKQNIRISDTFLCLVFYQNTNTFNIGKKVLMRTPKSKHC